MINRRHFLAGSLATPLALRSAALRGRPREVLIDSHVHVWKRDAAFPFALDAHPQPEDASAETLLELMETNDVSRTVLIQVIHYRWDNRYLASVLRRYPRKFMGVCRVNPEDRSAPDQLSRLTEVDGFHGVRLSPAAGTEGEWIKGPLMGPLWRRCAQLRVPMTLLTPVTRLPDIEPLIEAHPDLTVVIDHMADCPLNRPDKLELLLRLARFPLVFVKVSHMWSLSHEPYPYPDAARQVRTIADRFGSDRVMWGTDWPISLKQLSYGRAVDLFRAHLPYKSDAERENILWKTVQRVWPFEL